MANVIIFTNEYFPFKGGIGRYCEEVINEIKLQHKVTLVGPAYDSSLTRDKRSEGIRLELFLVVNLSIGICQNSSRK